MQKQEKTVDNENITSPFSKRKTMKEQVRTNKRIYRQLELLLPNSQNTIMMSMRTWHLNFTFFICVDIYSTGNIDLQVETPRFYFILFYF